MRANLATLVDEFRAHAAETAVVAHRGNRRYATSYGELAMLAGRFSAELARRGIVPGDRVVLWGANSAEWIAVLFGCMLRGVIAVPLDAAGTAEFAERVIGDTTPKLIVADAHLLAALLKMGEDRNTMPSAAKASRDLETVYCTAEAVPLSSTGFKGNDGPAIDHLPLGTIADHMPAEPLFPVDAGVNEHTPFQIVFTSGTTSEPRGIVHTHRNILVTLGPIETEMAKYRRYERIFHPLRFLHSVPLSHVFGQFMGLWCPALLAAEVHFAEELEPSRIAELIGRERISVLIAVPRVLQLLRAHLLGRFPGLAAEIDGAAGFSARKKWWRFRRVHRALGWKFWAVISGGATLAPELEAFWNRLGFALIQGYGMTETAALVTLNHPFHIAPGTIGKALPGREVKITDEGEILVRGDMLAEATWQHGGLQRREGEWLATGDLAERSASGELKFLGRKGDGIVTAAGLNIHPADLEVALTAQPGIRAAVVVGCDLAAGPEPVAVMLSTLTDRELDAAVTAANHGLADFQQIRRILRWPELQLPYTSTGKLIRRRVAQWACATLTGNRAGEHSAATQDVLLEIIAEVTGEPAPAASDANALRLSEDLHLDSLGRVQLQSALEQRFSLDLEDDAIATLATVADLRALIEETQLSTNVGAPEPASETGELSRPARSSPAATKLAIGNQPPTAASPDPNRYPHWPWSWPIQTLRVLWIELILRPLVWLLAAPQVTYADARLATGNLPGAPSTEADTADQRDTPLLLICNHITTYDGAFVLYALPRRLRHRIAAAMSGEMLLDFRNQRKQPNAAANLLAPAAYWLLTALFNVFPLPRTRGFRRSFAHAGEAMDRGYSVLIFPEGARSHTGHMNAFRPGIGLLARQSQAPILPVGLVGLYETGNSSRRWFHSGRVEIRIGQPIPAPAADADPAQLTAALERSLRALVAKRET